MPDTWISLLLSYLFIYVALVNVDRALWSQLLRLFLLVFEDLIWSMVIFMRMISFILATQMCPATINRIIMWAFGLPGIHILTYSYLQVFIFLQYQYGARLDYHDWVSYTEVQRGRNTLDTSWKASSLVVLNTIDRRWNLQSLAGKLATVIHGSLKRNT